MKGFRQDMTVDIRVDVSKHQAYPAKRYAMKLVEGKPKVHYKLLWDFAEEMKSTNLGSTVVIASRDRECVHRFDKMYMCLYVLKKEFISSCRHVIGINNCFLKGHFRGVLLMAV